jgi:hypothetical protein
MEMLEPEKVVHYAGSEDALQSTGWSIKPLQPAADAAALQPASNATQPIVTSNVPVLQGVPIVLGSP